jgi:Tol biopolymer transport system component
VTKFTDNTKVDTQPAWSNNPHLIAFSSNRDGDYDIYEMDAADGTPEVQVTDVAGRDMSPTYAPAQNAVGFRTLTTQQCERLAFSSNRTGNLDIFITDGDTTTNLTAHPSKDFEPDWAIGVFGERIFWSSNRDGDLDIYSAEPPPPCPAAGRRALGATPAATHVINSARAQVQPSAFGTNLTYAGNQAGNYEIYLFTGDPPPTRLTNNSSPDLNPDQSHYNVN